MRRKIAAGSMALVMMLSVAACSKESEISKGENGAGTDANLNLEGFPIVKEKISLTMMGSKAATQGPWEQMDFFKEMEELTNISFQFDTPPSEGYAERKNLAFASGEYPDVFFAGSLTESDETNYGKQGILIPLEELIEEYAPHISALFNKYPDIKKSVTAADGHIYALPQVTELAHNITKKTWINGKWMTALGLAKAPETTEELYDVLKAFKEGDANGNGQGDEIPLSAPKIDDVRVPLLAAFGLRSAAGNNGWFDVRDDQVKFIPIEEGFKQYLLYARKLFQENLLDNEIFSHTNQQFTAKGKANTIGVFVVSAPHSLLDLKTDEEIMSNPPLAPMTSAFNQTKMYPLGSTTRRGTFAITNKNQYPEATIRWVDYLYSQEGGILLNSGIEGKGWKWTDASQTKWQRIAAEGKTAEETRATHTPESGSTPPIFKDKEFHYKIDDPVVQWLHQISEQYYMPVARENFPLVYFTDDEQKRLNALVNDINTYVTQMEAKFIMGAEPMENWDSYLKRLDQMKLAEYVTIYQSAYDRWNH